MRYLEELYSAVSGMSPREMNERQLRMIDLAVKEVDRLRADVALATDTIQKCTVWIEEAKPLLEKGGQAEAELTRLRSDNEALKADGVLLDGFEKIRSDDVRSRQVSEDAAEHELVGHFWATITVQSCDLRVAMQASIDAARSEGEKKR